MRVQFSDRWRVLSSTAFNVAVTATVADSNCWRSTSLDIDGDGGDDALLSVVNNSIISIAMADAFLCLESHLMVVAEQEQERGAAIT